MSTAQNTTSPLVYNNMGWLGDGSHRGQGCQAWTAVGLLPRYPQTPTQLWWVVHIASDSCSMAVFMALWNTYRAKCDYSTCWTVRWEVKKSAWHWLAWSKLSDANWNRTCLIRKSPPEFNHWRHDFRRSNNLLNVFIFTNICNFTKLFMVNHKHVCICVWQTSQPAAGAVSATTNVNKYGCVHTHTTLHVHNWCIWLGICA